MTVLDTGTDDLRAEISDGVATIVLDRPERLNAVTSTMLTALGEVLSRLDDDASVGAILLTGAGGAFCSGGDVAGFAERGGDMPRGGETAADWQARRLDTQVSITGRLRTMDTPSVAVLPGVAAGAGLAFALACDLRVGCAATVVSTSFVKVGLSGDFGVSWLLHQAVGPGRAARLMLLSERLAGAEAAELGLIDVLVETEDVAAEGRRIAGTIAASPREAVRAIKANLRDARRLDLAEAMQNEVARYRRCADGEDHQRAVVAFVAERARRRAARTTAE